jgi:hypothetical protein
VRSPELLLSGCQPFAIGKMRVKKIALCKSGDFAAGRCPLYAERAEARAEVPFNNSKQPAAYAEAFRELSFPAALALYVAAGEEAVEHGLIRRARGLLPSALQAQPRYLPYTGSSPANSR